jgi:hypothetical protein
LQFALSRQFFAYCQICFGKNNEKNKRQLKNTQTPVRMKKIVEQKK